MGPEKLALTDARDRVTDARDRVSSEPGAGHSPASNNRVSIGALKAICCPLCTESDLIVARMLSLRVDTLRDKPQPRGQNDYDHEEPSKAANAGRTVYFSSKIPININGNSR